MSIIKFLLKYLPYTCEKCIELKDLRSRYQKQLDDELKTFDHIAKLEKENDVLRVKIKQLKTLLKGLKNWDKPPS